MFKLLVYSKENSNTALKRCFEETFADSGGFSDMVLKCDMAISAYSHWGWDAVPIEIHLITQLLLPMKLPFSAVSICFKYSLKKKLSYKCWVNKYV